MLKKLFIFCCTLLCSLSVWAEQTASTIQQTPFGEVELISCTTDLRTNGPLYLGVRALPTDGWELNTPDLKVTSSENLPIALFTPFKQPYPQEPLYPISSVLAYKPTKPITFNVEGSWRACKDQQCITTPIRLSITLETALALLTPECSPITLALSNTPIPMHSNKVTAYAQQISNGDTKIVLDFHRHPRTLTVYDENKEPLDLNIEIKNKRATFILPKTQNATHFIGRTYHHYYEIEPEIIPTDRPIPTAPLSIFQILQACFLFFLLSAIPIYWARVPLSTHQKFRSQAKQMLILTIALGIIILCGTLLYAYQTDFVPAQINQFWQFLIQPMDKTKALILMILGILFIPASSIIALLFLFVTPRPYLAFLEASDNLFLKLSPLFSFVFLTLLTFSIQLSFEQKIFKFLHSKQASKVWWVARLPWLALILYTFFYL